MSDLRALIAAHPLQRPPYNAIKFVRLDGFGTPLYRVSKDDKEMGAATALKAAFEQYGGKCFHCHQWMPAQRLSHECTRDHVRARKNGGANYLHNLVIACGPCNRKKGGDDLISFNVEAGEKYLKALEAHLTRCVRALARE